MCQCVHSAGSGRPHALVVQFLLDSAGDFAFVRFIEQLFSVFIECEALEAVVPHGSDVGVEGASASLITLGLHSLFLFEVHLHCTLHFLGCCNRGSALHGKTIKTIDIFALFRDIAVGSLC